MKEKVSYPISQGMKILMIADMDEKELKEFIKLNREAYNGID